MLFSRNAFAQATFGNTIEDQGTGCGRSYSRIEILDLRGAPAILQLPRAAVAEVGGIRHAQSGLSTAAES
jgi:hypothetical protein